MKVNVNCPRSLVPHQASVGSRMEVKQPAFLPLVLDGGKM
jgi:hypothetical protein